MESEIKHLKKRVDVLEDIIRSDPKKLSMFSAIQERDDMIFSLEKQLSDARNEVAADRDEINALRKWLAEKARYIDHLEHKITSVKEALKND